ncbi:hypothetical protein PG999_000360 [Apiospora kogelbergensis]|uniref:SRR1-like domain-containing protein n=1 Tax=Apiospora kogelbergensis TaxID=1337665 RepID=A0AAW0RBJ6_9PEZI
MEDRAWIDSSQKAADLLASGVKLWLREDLRDIETQLSQWRTHQRFTLRRLDGTKITVPNHIYGVDKPIRKPFVLFHHHWGLMVEKPRNIPPEGYLCSYVVMWDNVSLKTFYPPVPGAQCFFEQMNTDWKLSNTCNAFRSRLHQILSPGRGQPDGLEMAAVKKVTKVICFGLGDMAARGLDWVRLQNAQLPDKLRQGESAFMNWSSFTQHAAALTILSVVESLTAAPSPASSSSADTIPQPPQVRLLTQDPAYSPATLSILQNIGKFQVVGEYGAGGFAEVDDDCIIFAPFVAAPVKQIVEALARPVAMIYSDFGPDIIQTQAGCR